MKVHHLVLLACPECKGPFTLFSAGGEGSDEIETGTLCCQACRKKYPILNHIPRFVSMNTYSDSFGFEWERHARTQYDSYTGTKISEERFFHETGWDRDLRGKTLLEAGSGSGRFTEIAAATGATVVSLDSSTAVEANYASNGACPNVLIVQADLHHLPLKENSFDRVLCIGVLQHTPDVQAAFLTLARYVKPGGRLCIDVYRRRRGLLRLFQTRYFIRPFFAEMPPERLYAICKGYIERMWRVASVIHRIPRIGSRINWILLVPDYRDLLSLPEDLLKDWAILDAFDILAPVYDSPQYRETVREWFTKAGFIDAEVEYGYNGIEGRGTKS
ncbi:MAG: methyltransferase domain-containing protein [Methanomicrobiales archaeon]|nr:methyltransferase domain-containing protein [Methanomicrobiales archaeon]